MCSKVSKIFKFTDLFVRGCFVAVLDGTGNTNPLLGGAGVNSPIIDHTQVTTLTLPSHEHSYSYGTAPALAVRRIWFRESPATDSPAHLFRKRTCFRVCQTSNRASRRSNKLPLASLPLIESHTLLVRFRLSYLLTRYLNPFLFHAGSLRLCSFLHHSMSLSISHLRE